MFRFIHPYPDGRVFNRAIGGKTLKAAMETFMREHWLPELTGAIGVWQGETLAARVLVRLKDGTPVPYMREIDLPPSPPRSLACGD